MKKECSCRKDFNPLHTSRQIGDKILSLYSLPIHCRNKKCYCKNLGVNEVDSQTIGNINVLKGLKKFQKQAKIGVQTSIAFKIMIEILSRILE